MVWVSLSGRGKKLCNPARKIAWNSNTAKQPITISKWVKETLRVPSKKHTSNSYSFLCDLQSCSNFLNHHDSLKKLDTWQFLKCELKCTGQLLYRVVCKDCNCICHHGFTGWLSKVQIVDLWIEKEKKSKIKCCQMLGGGLFSWVT